MGSFLNHRYGPTILYLFSDFAFSLMDGTAQMMEIEGLPTGQVVLLRMIFTAAASTIWIQFTEPQLFHGLFDLRDRTNRLIWLRGINHTLALCGLYTAFRYLPLSDAMAIGRLRPFPIALLCFVVLREPVTWVQGTAAVISMGATLLVVKPRFLFGEYQQNAAVQADERVIGFSVMATVVLLFGVDALLVRLIGVNNVAYMLLVYSSVATMIGPAWVLIESRPVVWSLSPPMWLSAFFLAATGLMAQLTSVAAMQREHGVKIAILGYFEVVFTVFVQYVFTSTVPTRWSLLGIAIIMTAGIWCILKTTPKEGVEPEETGREEVGLKERGYSRVPQDDEIGR